MACSVRGGWRPNEALAQGHGRVRGGQANARPYALREVRAGHPGDSHSRDEPLQAFYEVTLGNARALDLDRHIGALEVGIEADLVVLDARATPAMAHRMETVDGDLAHSGLCTKYSALLFYPSQKKSFH